MTTGTVTGIRFCTACARTVRGPFAPGPAGRPDASCPHCRSLERQRFLALLLAWLAPSLGRLGTVLDIAPSEQVTPLLERLQAERYIRLDLGADNRLVDVLGSVTALPLPTDSVDLLICYHVLEHVPDDAAAMRELARVLRPGAVGLVQVPWRPGSVTDEDPDAPEQVRIERFGQSDHVRYYGDDFEQRLLDAGLSLRRVTPEVLLGARMCEVFKVLPWEWVWLVTPAEPGTVATRHVVAADQTTSLTGAFDAVMDLVADAAARVQDAAGEAAAERRRADMLQVQVGRLRGREALVYRVARRLPEGLRSEDSAVGRRARRLLGR